MSDFDIKSFLLGWSIGLIGSILGNVLEKILF